MNIFAIEQTPSGDIDWVKSAQAQDNYRVVKMILESCQMLCTVINVQHDEQVTPYRTTHAKHPSTLWVAKSSANFQRLVEHTLAMLEEYTERFNKIHKCAGVLEKIIDIYDPTRFACHDDTPLPLCMPDEFKTGSIVESYRKFYASKPRMRYPTEKIPVWWSQYRELPFQEI